MRQLIVCIGLAACLARAEFAPSASYDTTRQVKLHGAVTRLDWVNPRAYFFVNVKDTSGLVTNWAVDFGNPLDLEKDGWKPSVLHIGDVVTVEGLPARGSSRRALAKSVVLDRTGMKLFAAVNRPAYKLAPEPTPRWPDGQVRLGPAPGKK
jgi:hypothetical protein